ncbi:hypothetical protein [Aneurinibacillus aneurinilyticus]|uniref:Uncharacterized protein n=1 Tax=Aneurinibacillus aneurinilyticus ATCC 12856 TaxID=649747 RepID=U1X5K5_ANEAE|nr:hypothetical protein [Aneurinibacillus aneurinilyticus]ERI10250.1 hypothetical protein HMPREF0083_01694 [Aneurinibacillus aneurinilyticus ATCC 12856]MED0705877.1 hypothetical protein [Aneurinibacillus aneurinilyticus]MED0722734.1 hypothetical protein [Aneurinibacillus aneurinilyticus]MED0731432.1 hypothetical protein [Aneurinibacillus aneurinilyticus]MED0740188.1 hypothetical protein [Aneurinibacillus aneurinilyticus]
MNKQLSIGDTIFHEKYGSGEIVPSDDVSISEIMVKFDRQDVVDKYVCFDGIQPDELVKMRNLLID